MKINRHLHLFLLVPLTLITAISAHAQCPTITCPANISVNTDPNTCGAIVSFIDPAGSNPCGGGNTTFNYTGSMQNYTVPVGVTSVTITAKGAQGGNNGGQGAVMEGTFAVTPGDVLKVLVGGQGSTNFSYCGTWFGAGGGGGSFVTTNSNTPMIIAGGGGGNICVPTVGMDAVTITSGENGYSPAYPQYYGVGGSNGYGATNAATGSAHAGNGAGLLTNGADGSCGGGGQAFVNGGAGGTGCNVNGGFGGGGAGGNAGGGGGGGYSGGGGSYHFPGNGGGGGSYNNGTNQSNSVSNTGNGQVVFSSAAPVTVTLIAGLASGSTFPIGTTTETYQVQDALGNTANCSFTITVTDTAHPHIVCPGNVSTCTNIVNGIAPTVTNATCSDVTYTITGATTGSGNDDASGTYFNTGLSTVKYKVSNPNGNADSCTFTVTITPPVVPTIGISASPGNSVCTGTSVTYTASITNGGPSPVYEWRVNNVVTGSGSTYNYVPQNNDQVTCTLISNATCANPATVTSNTITMTVSPYVAPSVSISASPGSNVCAGTQVTYSATITNGGPSPSYQWKVNNMVMSTSATYTYAPQNNDVIVCIITSNAGCANPATATSNSITMTVTPSVTPTISISANPGNNVCSGISVTYSATITNGGPSPGYQWKVNNIVMSTSPTYTYLPQNNDNITCTITSNATCANPATLTSNTITMTVSPVVSPTISITVSPSNSVCSGTSVTFTATTTNGGPTPTYQWAVNNVNIPGNSPSYTYMPANGDNVTCTLTSNASCANPATVTSNTITMVVTPSVLSTITITANPGSSVCANTQVTYTATITNGGPSPVYEWKKNNVTVGSNPTYTYIPSNGDNITCTLTSNASCASPAVVTSNTITMTVTPVTVPTISITADPGNNVCEGTMVAFVATINNGGPSPMYQWKVNNVNTGNNSPVFTSNTLNNTDIVSCVLTSNASCVNPATATSNSITMTIVPLVFPSISISASPGNTICPGDAVTFTATVTNGGPAPAYQWIKNGNNAGTSSTYTDNSLNNYDTIACILTSNETCATPATIASSNIIMTVLPNLIPSVSVAPYPNDTVCNGGALAFIATPVNGGNNPSYQWQRNGNPAGNNSNMFVSNTLSAGDVINCVLTSNATCVSPATATSNNEVINVGFSNYLAGVTGNTLTNHYMVNAPLDMRYTNCDLMATVDPTGNNPVSGNTIVKVTLDPFVNLYNAEPYVQRHFDIEPDNNPSGATANITLYAYQGEFDAYNAIAGPLGLPLLPGNASDNGNVRITQFHGVGSVPGSYSGNEEFIIPSVSWDAYNNWWKMTFPVNGFSGFYIHTGNGPLSIKTMEKNGFSIVAFPNPVQDKVTIEIFGKRDKNSIISITDLSGRTIISVPVNSDKAIADISALAQGMYLVRYTDDTRSETIKITKQ